MADSQAEGFGEGAELSNAIQRDGVLRAGDEIRTRDHKHGKLVLYQLSYSRRAHHR